jgi:hypothetical protein
MSDSEGGGEDYGEGGALSKFEGIFLGDCISFFIEGTKTEAQGVVVTIFRDREGDVFFEVNVMQKVPATKGGDIVNKSNQVYQYSDTDELLWVRSDNVVRIIPLAFIEGGGKTAIYSLCNSEMRKLMIYYTSGPEGVPGLPMRFKLFWWHFDPRSLENLDWKQRRCGAMNDEDLTSGLVCLLKPIIFDPFVSPLSYSHRHPQKHWNIRTWKLLLRHSVKPVDNLEYELDKLSRNSACDMVFKEEVFLLPECIGIIRVLLEQWIRADHKEMSPYEARVFMRHHEGFVERALGVIEVIKDKRERDYISNSSSSSDDDLDEHMSIDISEGEDSYSDDGGESC